MRRLAVVVPVLALAACTSTVTGSPAPAGATSTTPATQPSTTQPAAASVTVGTGCDLLEPSQVEQVTGRSGVIESPSGLGQTGDYQGCFYDDTREIFLTASFARGFVGTDGQQRAEQTAAAIEPSVPVEPVSGIGAGAAYSPGTDGQAFVAVAFPDAERDGLLVVTVTGALPREQLEALARQVDDNL